MTRTIVAPAKINLCLHILGRRPDGYHELAMLVQPVSLFDRLQLALDSSGEIRVRCPGLELQPGEENIAGRAARRLLELHGGGNGVDIRIEKEIPAAAGLGGGSSDAAAVLTALNDMLGLGLSVGQLQAEGLSLGADVPFFLCGGPAWATGIGEVLEKVPPLPPVWYVLVNPGLPVSTAWVYRNFELTSPVDVSKLHKFPGTAAELAANLHNDLEKVTVSRFPCIAEIKEGLMARGALGALMSGSGPTVFGVFAGEGEARRAAEDFSAEAGWKVFVVQPLTASI